MAPMTSHGCEGNSAILAEGLQKSFIEEMIGAITGNRGQRDGILGSGG